MTVRLGVLVYGSHGPLHREASTAILSLLAFAPGDAEVVVITDRPTAYQWLSASITIDRITAAVLREWRGPADDRFRPKLEAVRCLARDQGADAVLFDADTMARRDLAPMLDRLARGTLLMHTREYLLAAPLHKGDRHLRDEVLGRTWQGITPDPSTTAMWNNGVIGVPRGSGGVMDTTLAVFDELRPVTRYFAVDQLSCSIVFPAFGPVEEAAPWVDHYWANRPGFDRLIERFLSTALMEGLSPADAADCLVKRPILAPLDGRAPWWRGRIRRWLGPPEVPDDSLAAQMTADSARPEDGEQ